MIKSTCNTAMHVIERVPSWMKYACVIESNKTKHQYIIIAPIEIDACLAYYEF